jgi:hypothetical protein
MFDKKFFASIPDDPISALTTICLEAKKTHESSKSWDADYADGRREKLFDYCALINTVAENNNIDLQVKCPLFTSDPVKDVELFFEFFNTVEESFISKSAKIKLDKKQEEFSLKMGGGIVYEFSEETISEIRNLLAKTRGSFLKESLLEAKIKNYFLKKIQRISDSILVKSSSISSLWEILADYHTMKALNEDTGSSIEIEHLLEAINIIWKVNTKSFGLSDKFAEQKIIK